MAVCKQKQFPRSGAIRSDDAIKRRAEKRGVTFEEQLAADIARAQDSRKKRQEEPKPAESESKPKRKRDAATSDDMTKKCEKVDAATSDDTKKTREKADAATSDDVKKKREKAAPEASKLDQYIAANDFDAKCIRALRSITEDQVGRVMKRDARAKVDPARGSHSLLVTAIVKQIIQKDDPEAAKKPAKLKHSQLTPLKWPEQAGQDRIEYNRALRERYLQHPEALTEVETERAKVLVARDERKKSKKGLAASS